jgi:hypothetical protein
MELIVERTAPLEQTLLSREFEILASRGARAQAFRPIRLHQGERRQVRRCTAVKSRASRQRGPASADARRGCASTVTSMLLPDAALRSPEALPHDMYSFRLIASM